MIGARNDIRDAIWRARERAHSEVPRTYLGASAIGAECDRQLWYQFRHVYRQQFEGRMLRLFETGHLEEPRIYADLEAIGIEVQPFNPETDRQFQVSVFGGHGKGHTDGRGRSEAWFGDPAWRLLECKTHSAKSYAGVVAHGVRAAKPQHYAQMQVYMHLGEGGMREALYIAKNKDNDDLYPEIVPYDADDAEAIMARWERIIFAQAAPAKLHENPAIPPCKWCPAREHCHGAAPALLSCRTCAHAEPQQDGTWKCDKPGRRYGRPCDDHLYRPDLVPLSTAEQLQEDGTIEYRGQNGRRFLAGPSGMSSEQLESQRPWSTQDADRPARKARKAWKR